MGFFHSYKAVVGLFTFAILLVSSSAHQPQLHPDFYNTTCPKLLRVVKEVLNDEFSKDKRIGASLLRLHFHDCFVDGCDGSILLDDQNGERFASPNANSLRGYDVIDRIKFDVERVCSKQVSCADIVALAARESVVMLHGPGWVLGLGRRDSQNSNQKDAQNDLPSPSSNLSVLITKFKNVNLDEKDLVALSGAHTIGQARCTTFRQRIYSDKDINFNFAKTARLNCPRGNNDGNNLLEALDYSTPDVFDNNYFMNLQVGEGLLHSDQQLLSGGNRIASAFVGIYSNNKTKFFEDFASAMVKMSNIKPLTGQQGEIRKVCSRRNYLKL